MKNALILAQIVIISLKISKIESLGLKLLKLSKFYSKIDTLSKSTDLYFLTPSTIVLSLFHQPIRDLRTFDAGHAPFLDENRLVETSTPYIQLFLKEK